MNHLRPFRGSTWLSVVLALAILSVTVITPNAQAAVRPQNATPTSAPTATLEASTSETAELLSVIDRIRKRNNTLVAGVKFDFRPFGFINQQGRVDGFDIDLINAMAARWDIDVQFVQVTSSNAIQALASGIVDIVAASMAHKQEREEQIDFSQTYFLDGQSLLTRRYSGITGIFDLDDRVVAAIQGSTSIAQIQAYADANGINIEILPFQEHPPALAALAAGQVDALTSDSVFLTQAAKDNPSFAVVGGRFTSEP